MSFHNDLGIKFLYVGQIEAAKNEFNQVLEIDPLDHNATRGLFECEIYSEANNDSCDPELTYMRLRALEIEYPDDPLPYLYLGDFAYNLNDLNHSLDYYQDAISRSSSVAGAYAGMGLIYDEQGRPDLARKMFERAINLTYWNVLYRDNLADVCYELEDYETALHWYNDTMSLDKRNLMSYIGYSNSYRCTGDLESARRLQEQQIQLSENESILNLKINQETYFFPTNSKEITHLNNNNEKRYYIYYNAALTNYLIGDNTKTLEYLNKANNLDLDEDSEFAIKEILIYDIEKLQKAQPKFTNKTAEFRKKFIY